MVSISFVSINQFYYQYFDKFSVQLNQVETQFDVLNQFIRKVLQETKLSYQGPIFTCFGEVIIEWGTSLHLSK